ncbi:phage/plasmid primase, P4 family [Halobellus rubicundus]|uniref:Phage/plasmid primase, P4 family n=1 Tax=Halobellus rubicundus TaxID=2996466 RepID=A0ABD5M7I8_9EURY
MSGEVRITDEELGLADPSDEEQETEHPVPEELQALDQWVCWERVEDGDRKRKIPRVPNGSGRTARTNDPTTWGSFEEAVEASSNQVGLQVGFVLTEDDPFLAIDFDDVCNPETGEPEEWVIDALRECDSYAEVSPSATGLHIWLKDVQEPDWWIDTDCIEVYDSGQYITMTGDHLSVTPTTCNTPSEFEEWLQSHTEDDTLESSEVQTFSNSPPNDVELDVFDVLSSSFSEDKRVSHPYHGSETGTNFKVFEGGETWHCFRHDVAGNALHLIGIEQDVISCGDWKNRDLTAQEWAELFEAGREAGYDLPDHPDERQQTAIQGNIVEAIIESPSDWIWPDEKSIIAHPVGDANAREVQDRLEAQSLESDEVVELITELDDEYADAFSKFWQTPEAWSVSIEGPDHSWKQVKDLYSEKGQTDSARDLAVRLLRKEYDFITISDNEQMYCYNPETGVYESDAEQTVKARLEEMLELHYNGREAREIIGRLKAGGFLDREKFGQSGSSVCVANGVVDIETGEMSDFSPGYNFRSRLPVEYDPEAECPQFREFLEDVCPDEKIPQLQEFVGYCLQPQTNHKKALLLLGPTDAGKSVFLDLLQALFGADSTVNLSVQYLANQRWGEAELVGRMVNIRHDLDSTDIKNAGKIKELTAGNPVRAERKNQDPFRFEPRTKHIFAANQPPSRSSEDDGFWNRWLTVVFPERIPRQEQDPKLSEKLTADQELAGILNWAIEGYQRLEEQGRFTNEPTPSDNRRIWETYGNSVERFISRRLDREPDGSVGKDEAYSAYESFAKSESMEVFSKHKFTSTLKKKGASVEQRRSDGERKRVYTGFSLMDS